MEHKEVEVSQATLADSDSVDNGIFFNNIVDEREAVSVLVEQQVFEQSLFVDCLGQERQLVLLFILGDARPEVETHNFQVFKLLGVGVHVLHQILKSLLSKPHFPQNQVL